MKDLISEINEYKNKVEALAGKAALAEQLQENLLAFESVKAELTEQLTIKETAINQLAAEKANVETELNTVKAELETLKAEQKASHEKAQEMIAQMGLKEIPVMVVNETSKPSADSIRKQYASLSGKAAAEFYAANKRAILFGDAE